MQTREQIIRLFKAGFVDLDYVNALWLEGSDGLGKADEFSDLDFWFDVNDGHEVQVLDHCIELLQTLAELDFVEHYEHPHPKIFQRNAHLRGTSEYLMIDICVQSHSRGKEGCTFVEGDVAEYPLVLFDKQSVVSIVPAPPVDLAFIESKYKECLETFQQRARVVKYLRRGKYLEALAYYHKYVCAQIVNLFRLVYTPRHYEYGLVHISDHLPGEVVAKLERLYQVKSLEEIESNLAFADDLFLQAQRLVEKTYGAPGFHASTLAHPASTLAHPASPARS